MCDQDHLTPVELTKVPGAMSSCLILAGKIQEGTERCGFKLDFEGVQAKSTGKGTTEVENCFLGQCVVTQAEDRTRSVCDGGRRGNPSDMGSCIHPALSLSSAAGLGKMETERKPWSYPAVLSPSPSHLPLSDGTKLWRIDGGRSRKKELHFSTGDSATFFFYFPLLVFSVFLKLGRVHYRKEKGKGQVGEFQQLTTHICFAYKQMGLKSID